MNVLIAEDDPTSALLIKKVVQSAGYFPTVTTSGIEALAAFRSKSFEVVLTDWMMPEMDGIALVKEVRKLGRPGPVILMVTTLTDPKAKAHALNAGVDGYVAKPISRNNVLKLISSCIARRNEPVPRRRTARESRRQQTFTPAIAVGIAASTGGPPLLFSMVSKLPTDIGATYFITQHGPAWTLDMLCNGLKTRTEMPVFMAEDGMPLTPNSVYIAPGDAHLTIGKHFTVALNSEKSPVGLCPAANPMLCSIAQHYGSNSVGIILTGLGTDGSLGGQSILDAGGTMIAQNPSQAAAPYMPESAITMGVAVSSDTEEIPSAIRRAVINCQSHQRAS